MSNISSFSARFFLGSFCIHFVLLFFLFHESFVEYGVAGSIESFQPGKKILRVHMLEEERINPSAQKQGQVEKSADAAPKSPNASSDKKTSNRHIPVETGNPVQDFVAVGLLTRLPKPVADVELNVSGINDTTAAGKIEMLILINVDGTVADVIPEVEMEKDRDIADRIAKRFKRARFTPGEINGVAVKSKLRIMIVSEDL
jgi:hypothetical protein